MPIRVKAMRSRLFSAHASSATVALLLLTTLLAGCERSSPLLEEAGFTASGSERIYAIELGGEISGHLRERRAITASGHPRMTTEVRLMLPGNGLLTREERLQFAPEPPHALLQRTRFTRTPNGVEHHDVERGDALGAPTLQALAGGLDLDGLAVGEHTTRKALFASATDSDPRTQWTLEQRRDNGALEASGRRSDGARVRVRLDPDGEPEHYRIGEAFAVRRVATRPDLPETATSLLLVPADRALNERADINSLELILHNGSKAGRLFEPGPGFELANRGDNPRLRSRRLLPANMPDAKRQQLQDLIDDVRRRIRYSAGAEPPDLDALLEDGRGDCYEFASLFQALGRDAGLETRVVTGLAWAGNALGGFAPHAWNEVRIDGHWVSVDPTWNQLGADATHLRFPADPARQLDLQLALRDARLEVVTVERDARTERS